MRIQKLQNKPESSAQEHQSQPNMEQQSGFYLQSECGLESSSLKQNYAALFQTSSEHSCHFPQLMHALMAPAASSLGSDGGSHRKNEERGPALSHGKHLQQQGF